MLYNLKMNIVNRILFSLILFFSVSTVFSADLPFKDLSDTDLEALLHGEAVSGTLDSYKDIRLMPVDGESQKLLKLLKKVDPNFLSEIIMVIPVQDGEDHLSFIRDILMDVVQFDNISYYSVRNKKVFPLFEDTEITSVTHPSIGQSRVSAVHTMKPFRSHENKYEYLLEGDTLYFTSTNTTPIYYNMFRAVKKGNMINVLWIQDRGDTLIVYGAGGAAVSSFFNLFGDRLDDSFTGRVQAFFSWFYDTSISVLIK